MELGTGVTHYICAFTGGKMPAAVSIPFKYSFKNQHVTVCHELYITGYYGPEPLAVT